MSGLTVAVGERDVAPVIEIEIRSVYGIDKAYPANPAAQVVADIAQTRTLTKTSLELARQLGFSIVVLNRADNVFETIA